MFELTNNRSATLESFRAISAFTVMLAHCYIIFISNRYPDIYPIAGSFAQSSVMVFFVLSGFLIGLSVKNNLNRNKGTFCIKEYADARFFRIYPPLIFSLVLTAFLSLLSIYIFNMPDGKPLSAWARMPGYSLNFIPTQYFSTLTFSNYLLNQGVSSNGSLWSLPIEVWCYVVAGLMFVRNIWIKTLSVCLFLVLQDMHIKFRLFSLVWALSFVVAFAMPVILKIKYTSFICILISITMASFAKNNFIEFYTTKTGLYFNTFIGLSFLFLLIPLLKHDIKINIFKAHARYSYSLYLIHFPLMIFAIAILMRYDISNPNHDVIAFILLPLVCIWVSKKSALLFENRNRIKNILTR
ncbi:acyltransferase [Enterobacter cloacae]|uniref:acyltransferase family protein n=1 Tax=Enterobacter cloacae TaxID=550 RepID=UPI002003CCCA|nr:acyltransferase [Enterobacter cloacae]MCK6745153.1 acyltransferase [Enterobacter cloacae]MCK6785133.1 acyltransferase [Enterobacter cloacae]